jgi:hypothetical protein
MGLSTMKVLTDCMEDSQPATLLVEHPPGGDIYLLALIAALHHRPTGARTPETSSGQHALPAVEPWSTYHLDAGHCWWTLVHA